MNPKWFGDSYDIVKRFFARSLNELDYDVFIDPMLTGEWQDNKENLYNLLCMRPIEEYRNTVSALFLDPDTGIGRTASARHTTIEQIVTQMKTHEIVFSFDQSFSRGSEPLPQMTAKLKLLRSSGGYGFYFDSHARFLFASLHAPRLETFRYHLRQTGLPKSRFVTP